MAVQPSGSEILFENEYIVSREGSHQSSVRLAQSPRSGRETRAADRKGNGVRYLGLILSVAVIFVSIVNEQPFFLFVGILLALVFLFRVLSMRTRRYSEALESVANTPFRPSTEGWKRIIQFSDHVVQVDPDNVETHDYRTLVKRSEDRAYCSLFFADHSIVRVSRQGFTKGTYEDFAVFMDQTIESNRKAAEYKA